MAAPLVSIITVSLNSMQTIQECMKSVQEQTYPTTEHIVIDGGSDDDTAQIIQTFHPTFFISEPDKGIYHAMNKGLEQAQGEYCIFLNADDQFKSNNVIAELVQQTNQHDVLCAGIEIYKGDSLYRKYGAFRFKPWMFTFGHQPPHPGFFCRTALLKNVGGFNEAFKIAGDFDLMLRVFSHPKVNWATTKLIVVNMQHGGASSGSFNKKRLMNAEVKKSLKSNGRLAISFLIWAKYLIKVFQIRG